MFIGHFGVGFAAKRVAPSVSLGTLFLAAQLADLLWPTLVLLHIEAVEIQPGVTTVTPLNFVRYSYSHSLIALTLWALVLGAGYVLLRRSKVKAGVVIAAVVLSHWVLDVLTHRPDLPVTIWGSARLGLGLWNSLRGTLAVEMALFIIGVVLYATSTKAVDRSGKLALGALLVFLLVVYFVDLFGPPPPSSTAVAGAAEAMWLLVFWGYWVDRHRSRVSLA